MKTKHTSLLVALLAGALCVTLAPGEVVAQDFGEALGIKTRARVAHGKQLPAVILQPQMAVKNIEITVARDGGDPIRFKAKNLKVGKRREFEFRAPEGVFVYTVTMKGTLKKKKQAFAFNFQFEVASLNPPDLSLRKKDVDVEKQRLRAKLSRAPARIEYFVIGDGGRELDRGNRAVSARANQFFDVSWSAGDATVEKISLRVYDKYDFWVSIDITPFSVFIPHDEVEFETGRHDIPADQAHKLTATLGLLREALEKHGREIEIHLYIAGYTDTVGDKKSNQELSERRAQSIARWFRRQGISIPIYYQGFGEDVLAVPTADETDEPHNRRAVYVLSAGAPAASSVIPRDRWKKL